MVASQIQLKAVAEKERRQRDNTEARNHTVVGFVEPENGTLSFCMSDESGEWQISFDEPDVYLAEKLSRVLTSRKRFIIIIGGRGSSKSVGVVDITLVDAKDEQAKTYCLREFQSSIKSSVFSLLKEEINRLEFNEYLEASKSNIQYEGEDLFEFAGLARNIDSVKSSHGFKRFFVEEAQFLSEESIEILTPTARNMPRKGLPLPKNMEHIAEEVQTAVSIVFVANPGSSEDPFSKRFIVPFESQINRDGYYEDDLHLIVKMDYHDNPWFWESGLEEERRWAYRNMSRALYDHVWLGAYNDSVENSLVVREWFDACIDAHVKLGFEPRGAKVASFDPSDKGGDPKAYTMRHGSIFLEADEYTQGDSNEGADWACGRAIQDGVDFFTFDADGLGAALNRQISDALTEKKVRIAQFKGSESPDFPDAVYQPATRAPVQDQKTNKDVFFNKRAQYYSMLRDRIYRTYVAVTKKQYFDPDEMISFSSNITMLDKLRAELCRMPIKPRTDGLVELYTKQVLRDKFKFASPNLSDGAMMNLRYISIDRPKIAPPKPIPQMRFGRRHR